MEFESIAKTNTTNTEDERTDTGHVFESIAKTNTTNTCELPIQRIDRLRVLLKQIQQTP